MAFRLSAHADADVEAIFVTGVKTFGAGPAEGYVEGLRRAFELLARFPSLARERLEIDPPVRVYPYAAHVIVYEITGDDVVILRVRHGREDWSASPMG